MPTTKPRIALTPPAELKAILDDLAAVLDKPTSAVIVGLLIEMQPQLVDLTRYLRHAKEGKKAAAKRALQHLLGNALAEQLELMKGGK